MVDLLVFLFICMIDGVRKSFIIMCKGSWLFCKIVFFCGVVPLVDAAMLLLALALFILCKIFKQRTPKLAYAKHGVVYPSWN